MLFALYFSYEGKDSTPLQDIFGISRPKELVEKLGAMFKIMTDNTNGS